MRISPNSFRDPTFGRALGIRLTSALVFQEDFFGEPLVFQANTETEGFHGVWMVMILGVQENTEPKTKVSKEADRAKKQQRI